MDHTKTASVDRNEESFTTLCFRLSTTVHIQAHEERIGRAGIFDHRLKATKIRAPVLPALRGGESEAGRPPFSASTHLACIVRHSELQGEFIAADVSHAAYALPLVAELNSILPAGLCQPCCHCNMHRAPPAPRCKHPPKSLLLTCSSQKVGCVSSAAFTPVRRDGLSPGKAASAQPSAATRPDGRLATCRQSKCSSYINLVAHKPFARLRLAFVAGMHSCGSDCVHHICRLRRPVRLPSSECARAHAPALGSDETQAHADSNCDGGDGVLPAGAQSGSFVLRRGARRSFCLLLLMQLLLACRCSLAMAARTLLSREERRLHTARAKCDFKSTSRPTTTCMLDPYARCTARLA
eukprot:6207075-Pleurochrysis_carterae.AAC.1